jgi:ESS family glutamate:Na+ symporter
MGVTATGILLLRIVDPENKSGAFESFAYKQLFFEPIVGGGLFTAAAPALIVQFGSVAILVLTSILLAFWLIVGFALFGKSAKKARLEERRQVNNYSIFQINRPQNLGRGLVTKPLHCGSPI